MSKLIERIDDAFTRPDPEDAIRLVKEAVIDEVRVLDPRAGVDGTRFFNHTIHPDFVLRWHERGQQHERPLYLRFEVSGGSLWRDFALHGTEGPLFIGLLDHRPTVENPSGYGSESSIGLDEIDPRSASRLDSSVSDGERRSLIAEASAIDTLENYTREEPRQVVATTALVRGGVGRIDADRASSLGGTLVRGFASAAEAQRPDDVFGAIEALTALIDERSAEQLSSHLQLLWLGSGGDLDDLFGADSLDVERLDDAQLREVLEHVLSREQRVPDTTLRRLGRALDPDRLGKMLRNFDGGHFDRFAQVSHTGWRSRLAQIAWRDEQRWGWSLDNERLRFDAGLATFFFTDRGHKLSKRHDGKGVPRSDFTRRLSADALLELDLTGRETEVVLRRRADVEAGVQVRPEQIDALGELAELVLRAKVESRRLILGNEDPVEAEIDYARDVVKLADAAPLSQFKSFVGRYFGVSTKPPENGNG